MMDTERPDSPFDPLELLKTINPVPSSRRDELARELKPESAIQRVIRDDRDRTSHAQLRSQRPRRVAIQKNTLRGYIFSRAFAPRWPRLAVVTAVLLLTGLTAASALALYDFVAGEPAPPSIADRLVREGTAERLQSFFPDEARVIADEAHGVAAIQTLAGRAILWVIPTVDGPICYFVEFEALSDRRGRPEGQANCAAHLSARAPIVFVLHRMIVNGSKLAVVVGWAHESVSSVHVRSPQGTERELSLSERFFLVGVPADSVPEGFRGNAAYSLIARDEGGRELERLEINNFAGRFFFNPKVEQAKILVDTTDSLGRAMQLSLFSTERGDACVEVVAASGTSTSCGERRAERGLALRPTLSGSMVYLSGSVGPEVATLRLHHQDGYLLTLPIIDRFVLHDVPRSRFEEGKRPTLLVARNRKGTQVAAMKIDQNTFENVARSHDDGTP